MSTAIFIVGGIYVVLFNFLFGDFNTCSISMAILFAALMISVEIRNRK